MNLRLVIERGAPRRVVKIPKCDAILGRARGNTVRIPSAEVSRQHCRLREEDGLIVVEDLGSVNGTFLNGRRLRGAEYVRPGDHIEVGPVTFVVQYELTPAAQERLRGEDTAGLLELLAEGDAVDNLAALADENLPVLEAADDIPIPKSADPLPLISADEDLPPLGMDEEPPPLPVLPIFEEAPTQGKAPPMPGADEPLPVDADAAPWQMPQGGDLRDLLALMEDEPTDPKDSKKKK
jgi:pSer/pThr/pTyr-binding forkhead associated (FHA) protein